MNKLLAGIAVAGSMTFAADAFALCSNPAGAVGGAAAGAAAGAAVGGPVGAAVGGVVGGTVGANALPPTACTYVVEQEVDGVDIEGEVVVGEPLPETVVLHEIPESKTYVFAHVNTKRVIVDPDTRVVVEVVN
jgi:hypothetical protein